MNAYLRNPLTYVWALLTVVTVISWWISQGADGGFQTNRMVTLGVLMIAALKVHLVMRYFMEVRRAPTWLKRTTFGWLMLLFCLLCGFGLAYA